MPVARPPLRSILLAAVLIATVGHARQVFAQWTDSFESPVASWWLLTQSRDIQLRSAKRVFQNAVDDAGFEQLDVRSDGKRAIQLAYRLDPMVLIDELKIRLWVKSSRLGAAVGARVVLPNSIDATTGEKRSVVVLGDSISEANRWTELTLEQIATRLDAQLPALRKSAGTRIDASEAYVDLIVVEDAVGRGEVRIGVDGLAIEGIVFAKDRPKPPRPGKAASELPNVKRVAAAARSPIQVKAAGGVFEINGAPVFIRAIEFNGESLEFLKSLGFNAVKLRQPPTAKVDQEANRLGIWLIAPPIFDPQAAEKQQSFSSVIAWDLGDDLGERELDAARKYVAQSRRSEFDGSTVFVACADSHHWEWSRLVDLMCVDSRGVFSTGELSNLGRDLQREKMKGRPGAPTWAIVHTEPPKSLSVQLDTFRPGGGVKLAVSPEQLRLQAFQAVLGGTRGMIFTSRQRLDGKSGAADLRAATVKWLNLQLDLVSPFAATGEASILGAVNNETTIGAMTVDRSTLFVLLDHGANSQFEPSGAFRKATAISLLGGDRSPRFQLTWQVIRQLSASSARDASKIRVERTSGVEYLIQSEDEAAVQFAFGIVEQNRRELAAKQLEVASLWLAHSAGAIRQVESSANAPQAGVDAALGRASQNLQRGDDFRSLQASEEALRLISAGRHARWKQVAEKLPSALVSPLCVSADLADLNTEVAALIGNQKWSANRAIAGDMERVESLKDASWMAFQTREANFQSQIATSDREPHSGRACLSLRASCATDGVESDLATVAITSPGVPVRRGDLVRYRVWVRAADGDSKGRLQLFDNFGGRDLAVTVPATSDWTSVVLYRFATEDSEAAVTAALLGAGQIDLDSMEVQTLSLQQRESFDSADK